MYRRRRLAVLLILLLVVGAGVGLTLWQPWNGSPAPASPSPSAPSSSSSAPATPDASPTEEGADEDAEETAEPGDEASSTPEPTETVSACVTSDLTVMAVTDKDSYGAGELPKLSISLSNDSDQPCLINVGTAKQEFVITSGSDVWWRSTDCQTESSDQVVQLEPGTTVTSVEPVVWDRSRSSVTTCDGSRPQALPGTYHLSVSIAGITAADSRRFALR